MRIEEIHVEGYGTLADLHIEDLSAGLSVFSGENEAGKTTLLDFIRGVLFGFPARNRRLPQHPPLHGGRHGGVLGLVDGEGREFRLERFVGAGEPLLTAADGSALPAATIQRLLGGADEALFRNVFAFGLSELSLFDSLDRAEVRDVLFSAGVLGAGRSARRSMQELESFRTTLVRPRKDDVRANALSRTIASLDGEIRAARRRADAYPGLLAEHARLGERVQAMRRELDEQRRRVNEIDRLITLWPTWRARAESARRLEELGPLSEQLALVTTFADDISYLREARSGHLERTDKHLEHLASIETATVELNSIIERLGDVRIAPVPLAASEELGRLKREAPDALAALRGADQALRKAVLAERESAATIEAFADESELPSTEEIEHRLSLVHRVEVTIARERLERERVAKQQSDAALQRALRSHQRGGADTLGIRVLLAIAIAIIAVGTATTVLGHRQGVELTALGVAAVVVGIAIGGIAYRMRRNLNGIEAPEAVVDEAELSSMRGELARLGAELSLDAVDESATSSAGDKLQRLLVRRRQLDEAELAHTRLQLECEAARSQREAELAAVASIDSRAANASALLGFNDPLGVEGLSQALEAITKAQELRDRIDRIRRADDLIHPAIAAFEETLRVTEAALHLEAEDDVTRRVRRLESLLDGALTEQQARSMLQAAAEEATSRLLEGLGDQGEGHNLWEELSAGELLVWEAERNELAERINEVTGHFEELVGEVRDKTRELEEVTTSNEMMRLSAARDAAATELDDVLEQWLVAGAAKALLERCLARYELDRQPQVIAYASELFSEVTAGRYGHVVVEEDEDGQHRNVIAIRTSGERVDAADLSRGTAEQLYLCLRLGFAESFAEQSVSLPLVVDDILVNFDPRRAAAVARILARVAESHQVIAFTCHPHIEAMFQAAAPDHRSVRLG